MAISYEPFFTTIDEKNVRMYEIEKSCGISSATLAKMKKGESVQLQTIEKICQHLNVPIEKVVRID